MGEPRQLLVTEAETRVVVDEADGLHERIDGHRAEELETARLQLEIWAAYLLHVLYACL